VRYVRPVEETVKHAGATVRLFAVICSPIIQLNSTPLYYETGSRSRTKEKKHKTQNKNACRETVHT